MLEQLKEKNMLNEKFGGLKEQYSAQKAVEVILNFVQTAFDYKTDDDQFGREKYFYPERLLRHAYMLLNSDGQMLIINQGETEAKEQERLLKKLNINYKTLGEIKSEHFEYQNRRFGYLIQKP